MSVAAWGIEPGKPLPNNVVGIKGRQAAFDKAEAELGKLPLSFNLTHPNGLQIRFFRVPENVAVDEFGLAGFGLVLLGPGSLLSARWMNAEARSEALEAE